MTDRTWHKGPPPHIGWWEADSTRCAGTWRWWNGKFWSWSVHDFTSGSVAAKEAMHPAYPPQEEIEWTDYYPENARVPRIDPSKKTKSN